MSEQDAEPEQVESLGRRFRAARLAQGMTLGQMAGITRIQEDTLRALEEECFDRLPPLVFAKGAVRSYARALKLDEDSCGQWFAEASAPFYDAVDVPPPPQLLSNVRVAGESRGNARRYVVLILLGILILVLLRIVPGPLLTPSNPNPDTDGRDGAPADRAELNARAASKAEPSAPVESSPSPPDAVVAEGSTPASADADGAPLLLELRALEDVWAEIRSDDGESREVLLREGERAQWRASDRFLLTLGNAGAVEATLNGRRQESFGDLGVVVRDIELRL